MPYSGTGPFRLTPALRSAISNARFLRSFASTFFTGFPVLHQLSVSLSIQIHL